VKFGLALALVCIPFAALAQDAIPSPFGAPEHQWASPASGPWGSSAGIERGPHGEIWAIDRCGANSCDGSDHAPIVQLDMATGKPLKSIGAGLFVFPHGLHVDARGNVWVTDGAISKDGSKGLQVTKLSPDGKVLLQLGTAGQRGDDDSHFQSPSDVITTANGDIFVIDGHAPIAPFIPPNLDTRVMKFDSHGKFLKQWGKPGKGPSEFSNPHALALDRTGRLYVADRANSRIQIFSQDGKFLVEWKQFGRPSGFYIAGDKLYAIDADSTEAIHPGWKKGVWIGSISSAKADAFVPDEQAGEGVVVAPNGNMFGAVNVVPRGITKYPKH
jgi:NHL repeat